MASSMLRAARGGEQRAENATTLAEFIGEADIMASLQHQCIVKLHGVMRMPTALVMELAIGGDLGAYIEANGAAVDAAVQLIVALDVARALAYMHSRRPAVLHRDLRSPNVFLFASQLRVRTAAHDRMRRNGNGNALAKVIHRLPLV
jgi:serine/threonine protein kinase